MRKPQQAWRRRARLQRDPVVRVADLYGCVRNDLCQQRQREQAEQGEDPRKTTHRVTCSGAAGTILCLGRGGKRPPSCRFAAISVHFTRHGVRCEEGGWSCFAGSLPVTRAFASWPEKNPARC